MTSDNREFDTILCSAIELSSPEERAEYVRSQCGDDEELRRRVQQLVDAHFRAGEFLESPAVASADTSVFGTVSPGPGTLIGPYKLLQQIGEGGMGVVFMAEQDRPVERTVALKIIKPGMDTRQVIARFEAERQALAMMDHPNIARVIDAGTTDTGRSYFVMDLVKGVPITEYCDQSHLTIRQRLELFTEVCHAVQHAHQKGIIHRDLKPSNVLVAEYDGRPVPKVIDFGVAKAMAQKLTEHTMFTQFGQVIGTFEYMSPEQARFNQLDVDTRSDIYSLGVLLYELLTGSTPLEKQRLRAAAFDEILRIISEEEPPAPSTRLSSSGSLPDSGRAGEGVSDPITIAANRQTEPAKLSKAIRGELDWIVMKCLEKDRNRRYVTVSGVADDIQRHLNDEPVLACPPSTSYRLRKLAQRYRGELFAAAIVFSALVLGITISSWQAMRATRAERQAEASLAREARLRQEAEGRERLNRANSLCLEGNFPQADKLFREIPPEFAELQPQIAVPVLRSLGNWNGGEQRWHQAAGDFEKLFIAYAAARRLDTNIDPMYAGYWGPVSLDYLSYAPVLVEIGDADGYNRLRRSACELLPNIGGVVAERMLNSFLLLPADDERTGKQLDVWGKLAVLNQRDPRYAGWHCVAIALLEYRRDNPDEALAWAKKCLNASPPPTCGSRAQIVMAMSFAQLNQTVLAQAELAQCRELIEAKFKGHLGAGTYESGFWKDWLINRILLREADRLLTDQSANSRPQSPADRHMQ